MPTTPTPTESTLDAQLLDLMLRVGSRWVLWLLLSLSIAAIAVALERAWFFVRVRQRGDVEAALRALHGGQGAAAARSLASGPSMQAEVMRHALGHASEGPSALTDYVAAAIELQRLRYERGLAFLGTLGNNAPFIGLFGTVLGIIRAFHDLAMHSAEGAQAVMAGIAEALVATGVGLLVALPAVAAYNAFARHVEACVSAATALGHELSGWSSGQAAGNAKEGA
jgi:biopolymer transport protein ExbB